MEGINIGFSQLLFWGSMDYLPRRDLVNMKAIFLLIVMPDTD
jgi:hypothetical protein